jgi:hypothetical protein
VEGSVEQVNEPWCCLEGCVYYLLISMNILFYDRLQKFEGDTCKISASIARDI